MSITLDTCISALARGKLANLSFVHEGLPTAEGVQKIIDALNQALLKIYTDLDVKENSVLVIPREGRIEYPLTKEHSVMYPHNMPHRHMHDLHFHHPMHQHHLHHHQSYHTYIPPTPGDTLTEPSVGDNLEEPVIGDVPVVEHRYRPPFMHHPCPGHLTRLDASWDLYIMDTPHEPFKEDILKILEVRDDHFNPLPLNQRGDRWTLTTPKQNTICIPGDLRSHYLNVIYKAKHPELCIDSTEQELEIPDVLLEMLYSYTAFLLHSDINTQEAVANAQKYLQEYTLLLEGMKSVFLFEADTVGINKKFEKRGWC